MAVTQGRFPRFIKARYLQGGALGLVTASRVIQCSSTRELYLAKICSRGLSLDSMWRISSSWCARKLRVREHKPEWCAISRCIKTPSKRLSRVTTSTNCAHFVNEPNDFQAGVCSICSLVQHDSPILSLLPSNLRTLGFLISHETRNG